MATSGNFLQLLTNFSNNWQLLATLGIFWQRFLTLSNFCHFFSQCKTIASPVQHHFQFKSNQNPFFVLLINLSEKNSDEHSFYSGRCFDQHKLISKTNNRQLQQFNWGLQQHRIRVSGLNNTFLDDTTQVLQIFSVE